jgi:hypothetical protein
MQLQYSKCGDTIDYSNIHRNQKWACFGFPIKRHNESGYWITGTGVMSALRNSDSDAAPPSWSSEYLKEFLIATILSSY